MKRLVGLSLLASALMLSACAGRALTASTEPGFYGEPQVGMVGGDAVAEMPAAEPELSRGVMPSNAATDAERLVIQTAALTMVVGDPVEKASDIRRMAEGMGGYVVSSYIYQSSYGDGQIADNASISVRVPANRLEEALQQIKADAVEVRSENISGEDVTAAYVDLESRLRNLEAAEEQLMEIMDSATKTEDVLAVYNQLVSVRRDRDGEGQMQYYEGPPPSRRSRPSLSPTSPPSRSRSAPGSRRERSRRPSRL
jgi:hypothetical protein